MHMDILPRGRPGPAHRPTSHPSHTFLLGPHPLLRIDSDLFCGPHLAESLPPIAQIRQTRSDGGRCQHKHGAAHQAPESRDTDGGGDRAYERVLRIAYDEPENEYADEAQGAKKGPRAQVCRVRGRGRVRREEVWRLRLAERREEEEQMSALNSVEGSQGSEGSER
jgi:hypothetical protein